MTSDYQFWLTANGESEKIQLPVNPEKFDVKRSSGNEKVTIAGLGEITIIQSRAAIQFSFSSFFPSVAFFGMKTKTVIAPLKLIKTICDWMESKKPIHFIVTSCGVDIYCTIESFNYSEKGGDVGTYEYTISLKEYREVTVRQIEVNTVTQTATVQDTEQRVDNTVKPKTYTVVYGDCLWNIAKKYYGDGSKWRKIYDANVSLVGAPPPGMIRPGYVLTIPD